MNVQEDKNLARINNIKIRKENKMRRIKGVEVLKGQLLAFVKEILYSLNCELQRIGRRGRN
jgi:hypothetical protein